MATRRLPDDEPPESPQSPSGGDEGRKGSRKKETTPRAHMPRTLSQVLGEANDMVMRGDLSEYVPLPTAFDPLDGLIGGGLRKTELVLVGGAQGIGKTIF